MELEQMIKALCVADKATLARVEKALTNKEETEAQGATAADRAETRLVTHTEAGRRLGLSRVTVWRLVKEGSLKGVNVRGKVRVRLDSVLAFALGTSGKEVA